MARPFAQEQIQGQLDPLGFGARFLARIGRFPQLARFLRFGKLKFLKGKARQKRVFFESVVRERLGRVSGLPEQI